jgi:hypothetical protein
MIVLPESRTFMAYGCGGSDAFYDIGGAITGSWQGTYATGGTMNDRLYLYDARDLKEGFDGKISPKNNILPYATFDMNFCHRNTDIQWIGELDQVRGLTFDPVNRIAYIHESRVGIHVLKFHKSGDSDKNENNISAVISDLSASDLGENSANITFNSDDVSEKNITIYPIPIVDILTIKGLTTGMIKLYNMHGTLLHESRVESTEHRIDMTAFAKGVYILNITNEFGSESFTIQK